MENVPRAATNNDPISFFSRISRLCLMQFAWSNKLTLISSGVIATGILVVSVLHLRKVGRYDNYVIMSYKVVLGLRN